jgi:hypothetical protein
VSTGKEQLLEFWRRSVRLAVALTLAAAVALWALWPADWPFSGRALALGLLLGSAAGVARFRLSLGVLLRGPTASAMVRSRLLGYGLSAVALLVAFLLRDSISPWTCAVGLLMMNGALLLTDWRERHGEPPTDDTENTPPDRDGPADNSEA